MTNKNAKSEARKFTVNEAIIPHLIASQSSTVHKAMAELIMNSVDAGASRCDIDLTPNTFILQDDGAGFRTREEILRNFENFGLPHREGEGQFGVFRIGRGQILSLAHTVYESNKFRMEVNFREQGACYHLTEDVSPAVSGCRVRGTFYRPQDAYHAQMTLQQIERSMRYVPIDVYLNGRLINVRPQSRQDWSIVDEDAYVRFTAGGGVQVYNMGVFVQTIGEEVYGCSGIVVTKSALPLNMARNDVLQDDSPAWQRIAKHLTAQGAKLLAQCRRLSEGQRRNCIYRFLAGDMPSLEFTDRKVFIDANNHHHSLRNLLDARKALSSEPLGGSRLAARVMDARPVIVVSTQTLEEFQADEALDIIETVYETIVKELSSLSRRKRAACDMTAVDSLTGLLGAMENIDVRDFDPLLVNLDDSYKEIHPGKLAPNLQAALEALQAGSTTIHRILRRRVGTGGKPRKIVPAISTGAPAWTNGADRIYVSKTLLSKFDNGLDDAHGVASILVHEYLHDESDRDSHVHSPEFYAAYHDLVSDPKIQIVQKATRSMAWEYAHRMEQRRIMPDPIYRRYADPLLYEDEEKLETVGLLVKGRFPLQNAAIDLLISKLDPLSGIVIKSLAQAYPYDTYVSAHPSKHADKDQTLCHALLSRHVPWSVPYQFVEEVLRLVGQEPSRDEIHAYINDGRSGTERIRQLLATTMPGENPEILDAICAGMTQTGGLRETQAILGLLPSSNHSAVMAVSMDKLFAEKGYQRRLAGPGAIHLEDFSMMCDATGRLPPAMRSREIMKVFRKLLPHPEDREWFAGEFLNERAGRALISPEGEHPMIEERASRRRQESIPVEIIYPDDPDNVREGLTTRDISDTGAFVVKSDGAVSPWAVLPCGLEPVSLRLCDDVGGAGHREVVATITRRTDDGIAVRFDN